MRSDWISGPDNALERLVVPPSWAAYAGETAVAHLKTRLEPITGIPSSTQKLTLRIASQDAVPIEAANEELVQLSSFGLQPYAEVTVSLLYPPITSHTGPLGTRQSGYLALTDRSPAFDNRLSARLVDEQHYTWF